MELFLNTNIKFIQLQKTHFSELKKTHIECLPSALYSDATYKQFLTDELFKAHGFVNREEQIISFIILMINLDICEIISIGTIKQRRHQGLASRMLDLCSAIYKPNNIFLEVEITNEIAINFYTHSGFGIINLRKKSNWGKDSFLMKKGI